MNSSPRPPPKVLLVHNGDGFEAHLEHLTQSGLLMSDTHADSALAQAVAIQPDLIVLDFGCDGETTAQLKADERTRHIPVIALVDLRRSI